MISYFENIRVYVKNVKYGQLNIEIIASKWKMSKFMYVCYKNHSVWDQTDNNIWSVITISKFVI